MQMDVGEEQLPPVEFHTVRDADIAHIPARAGGTDRLHHRFLRADALQHRVGADALGQLLDARDAFVAALGHDVGRAELACELLPRLVAAHGDDPLRAHLLGGEHAEQADRAVADDHDRRSRLHIGRVRGEPAGAQNIGGRQQTRNQFIGGTSRRRHQRAVRKRNAQAAAPARCS